MAYNSRLAFLTPPGIMPGGGTYFLLHAADPDRAALLAGALSTLCYEENWEQIDPAHITPEAAAEFFTRVLFDTWSTTMFVGSVLAYVTAAPPAGVLACDGGIYQRVDYPRLYDAIAAPFIIDADTFRVPDLRGRAVFGAGGSGVLSVGQTGGESSVTLSLLQMPVHSHTYLPPTINLDLESPGVPDIQGAGLGLPAQTGNAGGGQAHENMPPFLGVFWGILHG